MFRDVKRRHCMGTMLSALLHLQSVERQLRDVRGRLKARQNAVAVQQERIDQLRRDWEALHQQGLDRRKEADGVELDLREREEQVISLRNTLNIAKTNTEYAAVLTQINTLKADNAKLEDRALRALQDIDVIKAKADEVQSHIDAEEQHLREIEQAAAGEITRLSGMLEELAGKREEAAQQVPQGELSLFERITENLMGDAMAPVEVHGNKPPYNYICGGCFMALNAEHTNALRSRDEIRTCDCCGRILYLEIQAEPKP